MKYPFADMYAEKTRLGGFSQRPMTNPAQMARDFMSQAAGTYSKIRPSSKTETEGPGHTAGGAVMGAASGATTGALASMALGAKAGSAGSYWGAGIGAVVGLGAYLFS